MRVDEDGARWSDRRPFSMQTTHRAVVVLGADLLAGRDGKLPDIIVGPAMKEQAKC